MAGADREPAGSGPGSEFPGGVESDLARGEAAGGIGPDREPGWQDLDPGVVGYWRVGQAIGAVMMLSLTGLGGVILSLKQRPLALWILAAWLLLAVFRTFWLIWYPPRSYAAWSYRLDGKVLETRSGIWFRVTRMLPLPRLQHVDIQRGPIERYLGLSSLTLYTAGTRAAMISIPGLGEAKAKELRDHLVAVGGDDGV